MTKNKASALAPLEYEDTGIDLFKFIAAFLVLISHSGMLYTYIGDAESYIINPIFRWCVPFFFICTGFYLKSDNREFIRYLVRIIILYFVWTAYYIVARHITVSFDTIIRIIQWGIISPFWYFPALIRGTIFVYILMKLVPEKLVGILSLALYMVGMFGDTYANLAPVNGIYLENFKPVNSMLFGGSPICGLFFSPLFIWMGMMFSRHRVELHEITQKLSLFWILLGIIISILLSAHEFNIYVTYKTGVDFNMSIMCVFGAILFWILAYKLNGIVSIKTGKLLRNYSTIIYVTHYYWIIYFQRNEWNSIFRFVIISVFCVVTAIIIVFLGRYIKPLKYLY